MAYSDKRPLSVRVNNYTTGITINRNKEIQKLEKKKSDFK